MSSFLRPTVYAVCSLALIERVLAQTGAPAPSPFTPPREATVVTDAAMEPYEFAAVNSIGGKTSVYIFEKQLKRGKWIPLGATVDGITAKSYDAAREMVTVRIGDQDKVLTLRKASAAPGAKVAPTTEPVALAAWNQPPPRVPTAPPPAMPAIDAPGTAPTPAAKTPATPTDPAVIAHQEQEARMLVSDLLEIGMAQRKAYEEAQKKAAAEHEGRALPASPAKSAAN